MGDGAGSAEDLVTENVRLRRELEEMQNQRKRELAEFEAKVNSERVRAKNHKESLQERSAELESMRNQMVRLTRQLDEEVTKRDQIQAESQQLEWKVHEISEADGQAPAIVRRNRDAEDCNFGTEVAARAQGSRISMRLMRVVDQWFRHRDLQHVLLPGTAINDAGFATLAQALVDCPSLQTIDLSQNLITMDSCPDLCQLLTTAPCLSFLSLAENLLPLRCVGYFMTAVMERQNDEELAPLDLLELQGNEGLVAAVSGPAPQGLVQAVTAALGSGSRLPVDGAELLAQVMRALWRFLHDTGHPQVRDTKPGEVAFHVLEKATSQQMEDALTRILLLGAEGGSGGLRAVTANLAFSSLADAARGGRQEQAPSGSREGSRPRELQPGVSRRGSTQSGAPGRMQRQASGQNLVQRQASGQNLGSTNSPPSLGHRRLPLDPQASGQGRRKSVKLAEPLADLKAVVSRLERRRSSGLSTSTR